MCFDCGRNCPYIYAFTSVDGEQILKALYRTASSQRIMELSDSQIPGPLCQCAMLEHERIYHKGISSSKAGQ
jgi:hypothetical protein